MILGPINGIDCVAFIVFLIPQLVYQVAVVELLAVAVTVVPFLGRYLTLSLRRIVPGSRTNHPKGIDHET
jgi:hypothetical protein